MNLCAKFTLVLFVGLAMAQALPSEPPAKPTEKKSPAVEVVPKKSDIIAEEVPAIAIEGVEESKQADRAKKSASTTFCVEIRPGTSQEPVKVCEHQNPAVIPPTPEPQVPQEAHEIHAEHHPQQPAYIQHPEAPFYVIPPNPAEFFIPNQPCEPHVVPSHPYIHLPSIYHHHQLHQQPIAIPSNPWPQVLPAQQYIHIPAPISSYPHAPCPPSPCAASGSSLNPHAVLALYRSGMNPNAAMSMKSNDDASGMESSDTVATSRHLFDRLHGFPSISRYHHPSLIHHGFPHIARCGQRSQGKFADGSEMNNGDAVTAMKSSWYNGINPMMHQMSRTNEERSNGNNGANMNIVPPFPFAWPRNMDDKNMETNMNIVPPFPWPRNMDDKNMETNGHSAMRDEMAKRESEK